MPVHVPFAWHILREEPVRRKPESQVNRTILGNTVSAPEDDPFKGMDSRPQSTAEKDDIQNTYAELLIIPWII